MKLILPILIGSVLVGSGCNSNVNTAYKQIDQTTALEMMEKEEGHVVVDVRRSEEYEEGHIPGAILIPNETIEEEAEEKLPDKEQTILVYCRSGNRSKEASEKLADMGYKNVYEFGGINTWEGDTVKDTLIFSNFDGSGKSFDITLGEDIVSYTRSVRYGNKDHESLRGSSFDEVFTFKGIRQGSTTLKVEEKSSITKSTANLYTVTVDENLNVDIEKEGVLDNSAVLVVKVNNRAFYAKLENNSSAKVFKKKLETEPLEVDMTDYGNFEKVGDLPWSLPKNDESVTTKPGDIILYQGNKITLYYGENTWSFTKLATIDGVTREELLSVLGEGDVKIRFELEWSE